MYKRQLLLILQQLTILQPRIIPQKVLVRVDQQVHLGILQLPLLLLEHRKKVGILQRLEIQVLLLILVRQQRIRRFFLRQEVLQQLLVHQNLQQRRLIHQNLQQLFIILVQQQYILQHFLRAEILLSQEQLLQFIQLILYIIHLPLQQQRLIHQL